MPEQHDDVVVALVAVAIDARWSAGCVSKSWIEPDTRPMRVTSVGQASDDASVCFFFFWPTREDCGRSDGPPHQPKGAEGG